MVAEIRFNHVEGQEQEEADYEFYFKSRTLVPQLAEHLLKMIDERNELLNLVKAHRETLKCFNGCGCDRESYISKALAKSDEVLKKFVVNL